MWLWSIDQMYVLWNQAGPQCPPIPLLHELCECKQVMKSFCVSVSSSIKADGDDTYLIMLLWDEIMCIKYFHGADTYYLLNKLILVVVAIVIINVAAAIVIGGL